jgi:CBS domain-containing protein
VRRTRKARRILLIRLRWMLGSSSTISWFIRRHGMIPIRMIMSKEVLKTDVKMPVKKAARLMHTRGMGSLVIQRGRQSVGILTETDIVQKVVAEGLDPAKTLVGNIMSAPVVTIEARQSVVDADELMERHHVRHLVVLENQKIVGMVSVRDLLFPIQYLLAFANVDSEKESALISREVREGLKLSPRKKGRRKQRRSR